MSERGCGADICMAGCYGDYRIYMPATSQTWPIWFRDLDHAPEPWPNPAMRDSNDEA